MEGSRTDRSLLLILIALALLRPDFAHPSSRALLLLGGGFLLARGLLRMGEASLRRLAGWSLVLLPLVYLVHRQAASPAADLGFLATGALYAGAFLAGRPRGAGWDGLERWVQPVGLILTGLATLLAAHGILQVTFGLQAALRELPGGPEVQALRDRLEAGRAFATLLLPSSLGTLLAACLPWTAWVFLRSRGRWTRSGACAAGALQGTALFLTASLTGILAFVAAGAVSLWAVPRRWRGIAAAGAGALVVVAALWAVGTRGAEVLSLSERQSSFVQRFLDANVALRMIGDHPLVGTGNGGYGIRFPSYMEEGMNESRYAHNAVLQLAAENGLWVLFPLAFFAISFARRSVTIARSGKPGHVLLAASLVAYLAAFLVDFGLHLVSVALPFFALLGALYPEDTHPLAAGVSFRRLRAIAGVSAVVILAGLVVHAMRDYAGETLRESAGRLAMAGDLGGAIAQAERAVRFDPRDPDSPGLLAFLLVQQGAPGPARRYAEEAVRLDPWTPGRHETAAYAALRDGDVARAFRGFARAAELFPLRTTYREERDRLIERVRELRGEREAAR